MAEKLLLAASENPVCSVSLNMSDRIRLVEVPAGLTDGFRQAILEGWKQGIQDERDYHGATEFKLRGNPWTGTGDESVHSRTLVASVLTFMARNGWSLIQSVDLSKKPHDKHSLFFEQTQPDPDVQVFSLSFNMTDRIRVIGAPSMIPTVKNAVQNYWAHGIQNEREYHGSQELKLGNNPWYADGKETVMVRVLLNHLLADMRALGYKLYASIDISQGYHAAAGAHAQSSDVESWFFRKVGPSYW